MEKIKGYNGKYSVSSYGNVRNDKNGRLLTYHANYNDKLYVTLNGHSTKRIHDLVASEFLSRASGMTEVAHKDGNLKNNHVNNLMWVTKEDQKDFYDDARKKPVIKLNGVTYPTLASASRASGVGVSSIHYALKNNRKTVKGLPVEFY